MWAALEHLDVGMALCAPGREVLAADPGYAAIVGRTVETVRGVVTYDLTHPDDRPCNDRLLSLLAETRAPFRITKRYIVNDRPVWVENHVSWLGDAAGGGLLCLSRRLDPACAQRAPMTHEAAAEAATTAAYIRDMASQLAAMADLSRLPTSAAALRIAAAVMREEHEDLG